MHIKKTGFWKLFSSIKLAVWLIALITILSLLGTVIPQNQEPGYYIDRCGHWGYRALTETGLTDVYSSFWFMFLLVLFSLNLAVCLVNRISLNIRMLGSALVHASILVILVGALIGMISGQKGYIRLGDGEETASFDTQDRRHIDLGFTLKLDKFIYEEHLDPKEKLLIYSPSADVPPGGDGAASTAQGLIASVSTETGAESGIGDTGYRVKILRYLNDFAIDISNKVAVNRSARPNNPAIEVQLTDKDGKSGAFWVFSRFPDMHQKADPKFKFVYRWFGRQPKDFISRMAVLQSGKEVLKKNVRVNEPLRYGGYTFFQSGYDVEGLSWSELQAVKDPGVSVVYAGFILLILGLMIIFYVNPLIQRR